MENLTQLSDAELLERLGALIATQRRQLARLLAFLGEVEERRLHLLRGYSSLFGFCTTALHLSEGEAFRRIAAARLARRFPRVLELVARGDLHLTGLVLLRGHLTEDNHVELLGAVTHRSKRDVELLIAERFPRGDVKGCVRKLPAPRAQVATAAMVSTDPEPQPLSTAPPTPASVFEVDSTSALGSLPVLAPAPAPPRPNHDAPRAPSAAALPCPRLAASRLAHPRPARSRLEPLSPARYRIQLTATQAFKDKLDRARDLLAHTCPDGDLPAILERALDLLLQDLERSRRAKARRTRAAAPAAPLMDPLHTSAPHGDAPVRPARPARPSPSSCDSSEGPLSTTNRTAIPRPVRRAVFERDGDRCTFVAPDGRRCASRTFLELDHVRPHALGGLHTPENLRVLCRAHNRLLAEQTFGREHVEHRLRQRKSETTPSVTCASASDAVHQWAPTASPNVHPPAEP